ncbi:MAG: hypothetical protein Q8L24_00415, partial [bacterium]|nr:hypothetical protein [bacterium]
AIKANLLISTLVFFALPAIYLSIRQPRLIARAGIFAGIFGLPVFAIIDYLAETSGSWVISRSLFNFRFLGVVPIEQLLWGFFGVYFVIMFYERFFEPKHRKIAGSRMKYLGIAAFCSLALFSYALANSAVNFSIEYFYLKLGLLMVALPTVFVLAGFPALLGKFLKTGVYFSLLSLIYELTALRHDQWSFPGKEFVGMIKILGASFPIEELVFWIALGSLATLSFYEVFDDDRK